MGTNKESAYQMFQVAVVSHPTKADADDGEIPRIELGPQLTIARSEEDAKIVVATTLRGITIERMEIVAVPFGPKLRQPS